MKYLKLYEEFNIESDKNKKQTIFLFGPQGVGKTTICKLLSSKLNMKIIESDEQEFESYDDGYDSNNEIGPFYDAVDRKGFESLIRLQ